MSKFTVGACIEQETYRKLRMMYFVQNTFFENKDVTISSIVQDALKEYFKNHNDEYEKMMKEYREKGGWLEI